jgi:nitrate/nitrite transporter NarK
MVNSFGAVGAFLGQSLLGYLKDRTGTHSAAFALLGGLAVVGAIILLTLRSATGTAEGCSSTSRGATLTEAAKRQFVIGSFGSRLMEWTHPPFNGVT